METRTATMVGGHAEEAERLQARDRLRRMADECDALTNILDKGYMACTPENIIDCLQHILRVARGEDR